LSHVENRERYDPIAQTFHWLTVALVLAAYILSEGGPESRVFSTEVDGVRRIHETLGLLVFAVVVLRLIWRMIEQPPDQRQGPGWMVASSRLVHWLLYVLLVALPLTAIFGSWWEGHPVTPQGFDIAPLVSENHTLGQFVLLSWKFTPRLAMSFYG